MDGNAADTRGSASQRLESAQKAFGDRVKVSQPFPGKPPLWVEPVDANLRSDITQAATWMDAHHDAIEDALLNFGGILWRGFPAKGPDDFASLMNSWQPFSKGYTAGTSERKVVKGNVMESTRTPPEYRILLHQEMAYLETTPRLVSFYCHVPSPVGGHTIIGEMRGIFEALPEHLQKNLRAKGVRYARNLRNAEVSDFRTDPRYIHESWQSKFDTQDRKVVEAALTERGVTFKWEDDGSLSLWTVLPGTINHPSTGELLFFNQMYVQQQRGECIGQERVDMMDAAYGTHTIRPFITTFGDGERLAEKDFYAMHDEMERRRVDFDWQSGDIMLLENKLCGHGRDPYQGHRDIQVMLLE